MPAKSRADAPPHTQLRRALKYQPSHVPSRASLGRLLHIKFNAAHSQEEEEGDWGGIEILKEAEAHYKVRRDLTSLWRYTFASKNGAFVP